jgi:hypothetical protein
VKEFAPNVHEVSCIDVGGSELGDILIGLHLLDELTTVGNEADRRQSLIALFVATRFVEYERK